MHIAAQWHFFVCLDTVSLAFWNTVATRDKATGFNLCESAICSISSIYAPFPTQPKSCHHKQRSLQQAQDQPHIAHPSKMPTKNYSPPAHYEPPATYIPTAPRGPLVRSHTTRSARSAFSAISTLSAASAASAALSTVSSARTSLASPAAPAPAGPQPYSTAALAAAHPSYLPDARAPRGPAPPARRGYFRGPPAAPAPGTPRRRAPSAAGGTPTRRRRRPAALRRSATIGRGLGSRRAAAARRRARAAAPAPAVDGLRRRGAGAGRARTSSWPRWSRAFLDRRSVRAAPDPAAAARGEAGAGAAAGAREVEATRAALAAAGAAEGPAWRGRRASPPGASWAVESEGWWRRVGRGVAGEEASPSDGDGAPWPGGPAGVRVLEGRFGEDMSACSSDHGGVKEAVWEVGAAGGWRVDRCWWCGRDRLVREARAREEKAREGRIKWRSVKIETWDIWW